MTTWITKSAGEKVAASHVNDLQTSNWTRIGSRFIPTIIWTMPSPALRTW